MKKLAGLFSALIIIIIQVAPLARAQSDLYRFDVDQDRLSGAPDFGFLNHPLTDADRLFVHNGHFYRVGQDLRPETSDDERVRLFGVNLAFGANFPDPSDSARIAKRLRRLGVNLVRLHHMDSVPDSNPASAGSTLTTGPYPTLNSVAISRLRSFLDALKAEGIYADLNLHVGYTFRPETDGIPSLPGSQAIPSQSKPLHIFYPRMIELQKQYARLLIEALKLGSDPVLGVVEINNEDSLVVDWQWNSLDSAVQGDYRTEFTRQWNAFLKAKYSTTEALRSAWAGDTGDGPELLTDRGWKSEVHSPAQASFKIKKKGFGPMLRATVLQRGGTVIMKQTGFSISTDRPYLAEMEVRADLPAGTTANLYWDIKRDISPWDTESAQTITINNQWQKFSMGFQARFPMDGAGRFGIAIDPVTVPVYIRHWSLRQAARRGLAQNETLEGSNISLVTTGELATEARLKDYLLFLADRDRSYVNELYATVRDLAGPLVPITGTQMGFGGPINLDSHRDVDFQDNHFYIDHYTFPNQSWDGRDWYIRDQCETCSGLWDFQNVAILREAGKPYTVSEFNQPWPNTHAAEIDTALAAFAAFQDWDSLMHFAYAHGRSWDGGVPNGFNMDGDMTKLPNVGQAAWLFRTGAVRAGLEPVTIPLSQERLLEATNMKSPWDQLAFFTSTLGIDGRISLIHPVRVARDDSAQVPEIAKQAPAAPYKADNGDMTYDQDRKVFLIHSAKAAGVIGQAGGSKVTAGALDVELAGSSRGFASILLTPLDGNPLAYSSRLLLSTPGYTLRSQPGSNPARPQRLVNYQGTEYWTLEKDPSYPGKPSGDVNGGNQPVWMERVESYVTIRTWAGGITVYPLDGTGARLQPLSTADVVPAEGGFRIHLQGNGQALSPWYEIVTGR